MKYRSLSYDTAVTPLRARAQIWRIALGFAAVAVLTLVGAVLIMMAAALVLGGDFFATLTELGTLGSPRAVAVTLLTFAVPVAAVWVLMPLLHGVPVGTLFGIGERLIPRHLLIAFGYVAVVGALGVILTFALEEVFPNRPLLLWLMWLAPVFCLIFLQVFAEELVFRGYLQGHLAARFESALIWLFLPAVLFGFAHFRPSYFGQNAWLVVVAASLIGVVAGHITARTGNISAAVGLHLANNVVGLLIIGTGTELSALALFRRELDPASDAARIAYVGNIALIAVVYVIYLWAAARRDRRLQQVDEVFK